MCKLHFHNEDVSDESHVKVGKGKGGTDPIPFRRSVINLNNTSRTVLFLPPPPPLFLITPFYILRYSLSLFSSPKSFFHNSHITNYLDLRNYFIINLFQSSNARSTRSFHPFPSVVCKNCHGKVDLIRSTQR